MNATPLVRPYFSLLDRKTLRAAADAETSQRRTLASLLREARNTEIGRRYRFGEIKSPEEYASRVELRGYEAIRADVMRMVVGEKDILWPGVCRRYAQSSGTSGGKSKYIPLTQRSMRQCHYRGGSAVVARYLANYPDSRLFAGRGFVLGGSYSSTVRHPDDCRIGDLSASLIDCINPLANLVRVPSKQTALMEDWSAKLPRLVEETMRADVTNLSGVPSWFLTVIKRVLERAGATELHQVWPNLEVFFHGGIAFGPYRSEYSSLIDPERMRYMETYNASEGFFALQDTPGDPAMLLLMNVDVFYEFIPLADVDSDNPRTLRAWEVEEGKIYALAITSSNGLWRYMIGDTVKVCSTSPLRITIAGRTHSYINAFGEEVMVHNTDAALSRACAATGALATDYTVAPLFAKGNTTGRHQWFIEFSSQPESPDKFARILDRELRAANSDYDAKRTGDIFLSVPEIVALPSGTFDRYLASTGKLGGQRKVPRLKNDRSVADAITTMLQK